MNMKFNVFYSTFTNVFYSCHVFFTFFNVFYFNLNVFLHLWSSRVTSFIIEIYGDSVRLR